jgi:hypothetical protein
MRILAVVAPNREVSKQEVEKDMPELERRHREALKKHVTWKYFGGVLYLGDKSYQVV